MARRSRRRPARTKNTWTGTVHTSACLKNTSGRDYTVKENENGDNLNLLAKLYVNSVGQLVGVGECGSEVCAAETLADMERLAEFIANCCGKTLTAKPKA